MNEFQVVFLLGFITGCFVMVLVVAVNYLVFKP